MLGAFRSRGSAVKSNSQLSVALHALGHLAASERSMSSAELAECAGTNPVVVRRTLGVLREAGLVRAERGRGGGWSLGRPADDVTLADIHGALAGPPPPREADHDCAIAGTLNARLDAALSRADDSMRRELDRTTLADLV